MSTTTDKILTKVSAGLGWITFNNPARRNAMSLEMWKMTHEALDRFARDPAIRVVIMQGAGDKAFVSGADISQFEEKRNDAEQAEIYNRIADGAKAQMLALEKPLIAMIRGYCIGGGLAVAMCADIRIASDDSQFSVPAAKLGIAYGFEDLKNLVELVGPALAKEILFTGRRLQSAESLQIGLVNHVVPSGQLEASVIGLANDISVNAPLSLKSAKITINEIMKDAEKRDMTRVEASSRACFESQDFKLGRQAFMQKRQPEFKGI